MRISPLDIRKQPFRKTPMGFDKDAVNSFLEMVAIEYEQIIKQNDELSTNVKVLQERLDGYVKIERTLNETLLTAQRATDEARLNAQKEAELIIKDAHIRADKYEDRSRQKVNELEAELMSLKTQRDSFLVRFKSMLRDQLSLVEVISGSVKDGDSLPTRRHPLKQKSVADKSFSIPKLRSSRPIFNASGDETLDEVPPQPVV